MPKRPSSHKSSTHKPKQTATQRNILRIIAGQWRGRKLNFPSIEGLRPTPDRVRETLFNWLSMDITGARCLDLFSGSGALGLEALSRGAAWVDMVDAAPAAINQLRSNMQLLDSPSEQTHLANAIEWLKQADEQLPYDIIFLDPPFRTGLAAECLAILKKRALLKPQSWVYLEMGKEEPLPPLPSDWQLHREKQAGQLRYQLYRAGASV